MIDAVDPRPRGARGAGARLRDDPGACPRSATLAFVGVALLVAWLGARGPRIREVPGFAVALPRGGGGPSAPEPRAVPAAAPMPPPVTAPPAPVAAARAAAEGPEAAEGGAAQGPARPRQRRRRAQRRERTPPPAPASTTRKRDGERRPRPRHPGPARPRRARRQRRRGRLVPRRRAEEDLDDLDAADQVGLHRSRSRSRLTITETGALDDVAVVESGGVPAARRRRPARRLLRRALHASAQELWNEPTHDPRRLPPGHVGPPPAGRPRPRLRLARGGRASRARRPACRRSSSATSHAGAARGARVRAARRRRGQPRRLPHRDRRAAPRPALRGAVPLRRAVAHGRAARPRPGSPNLADWQSVAATILVMTRAQVTGGELAVELKVVHVGSGQTMASQALHRARRQPAHRSPTRPRTRSPRSPRTAAWPARASRSRRTATPRRRSGPRSCTSSTTTASTPAASPSTAR